MSKILCDFCCDDEPIVSYPAKDAAIEIPLPGGVMVLNSVGGWAACRECARLVDTGNKEGLELRTFLSYSLALPVEDERVMLKAVHEVHELFWANWLGRCNRE